MKDKKKQNNRADLTAEQMIALTDFLNSDSYKVVQSIFSQVLTAEANQMINMDPDDHSPVETHNARIKYKGAKIFVDKVFGYLESERKILNSENFKED